MYLHLDMDYFYAQVEEKRRPMAKDKIIVVCIYSGKTENSGVVSTVNYLGREAGIKSGMPIVLAKKKAPPADSIFLPADKDYYIQVSMYIDEIIRKHCRKVVQASIDEWMIEDDTSKAPELKDAVQRATGLTSTIGAAPSLLGAKMAASKAKPNGILILDQEKEKKLIDESDVEKVPGIGRKTAEALAVLGVIKVKDIASVDVGRLVETFGRKTGAWLHDLGQGSYDKGLGEEKEQEEVSRIGTLKETTREVHILMEKLDGLEKDPLEWMMHAKKSYRTLTVIFITDDLRIHTRSLSFNHPKQWNMNTRKEREMLIEEFLKENKHHVRRIGIKFGNFMDLGGQTTLF
ncbi:DNA polymerase IV [Candidatus Micrarchaeota archaeon]|nr:DNA polymerase IV [Candidatus Micrarchaeota archaeon]